MTRQNRARLEAAGFRIGSVIDFLDLSPEEEAIIERKLAASAALPMTEGNGSKISEMTVLAASQ